jgi:peptidoglycan L-alanyl-D-glutamate endopeptidase CwlK|tara:strand:- start:843 stop:1232 length:390 start_codon:yes stop_codon:yes gene_type:complete
MGFQLSNNSMMNLAGVDGRLIDIADVAIKLSPIDFGIPSTGGLRTTEDQAKLFEEGVSKADGVNNKSYHQTGKALDVYAYVDGKASWDKLHLATIAAAMLQASSQLGYELKWGGLWKSWQDYPHFEIKD